MKNLCGVEFAKKIIKGAGVVLIVKKDKFGSKKINYV